jgi:hypothetical protein
MKSHRKTATSEQKAAAQARRAELIARTRPLQAARKSGLLPWAELPTINACLEMIYSSETGATEWKTFVGWKEAGYRVIKGEKGFPISGRPIECKAGREAATDGTGADAPALEFFPVSYLFHAGQVADADGNRPSYIREPNAFAAVIRALSLALPAPEESASVLSA